MDAVISYVNHLDKNWQETYNREIHRPYDPKRFRDYGTINLVIDSIRRYAPFIDKIFVTVQNLSEIDFIKDKSQIIPVLHSEFIPDPFLPCFNSCTIETFMHRIPGLDEKFVYFNDDIFLINPVTEDFFYKDGKPLYSVITTYNCSGTHQNICKNSFHIISNTLKKNFVKAKYFVSGHVPLPFLKSYNEKIYQLCKNEVNKRITPMRSPDNTQTHLYISAAILQGAGINDEHQYLYLRNTSISIKENLLSSDYKSCCINDCGDNADIQDLLETVYYQKAKANE